jgi:hypothetical protein
MGSTHAFFCVGCGFRGEAMEGSGWVSGPPPWCAAICKTCRCVFTEVKISNLPPVHQTCGKQGLWLSKTAVTPPDLEKYSCEENQILAQARRLKHAAFHSKMERIRELRNQRFRIVLRNSFSEAELHPLESVGIFDEGSLLYDRVDPRFYCCPGCGQQKLLSWQTGWWD